MKKSLFLTILFLTGCASANGPSYQPDKISKGDVVVYRASEFAVPRTPSVVINGRTCELPPHSYVVAPASKVVEISATLWDTPGTSRIDFKPDPKETNYVSLRFDRSKNWGGAFGAAGSLIANSTGGGPVDMRREYPDLAVKELSGAREANCR